MLNPTVDTRADFNKILKLTATHYFGAKPQDQGCHSEPNLIWNRLKKYYFCVVLLENPSN